MISKTHLKLIFALLFLISLGFNGYFIFGKNTTTVTTPPIIGKFEPAIPISQKPVGEPLVVTWKTKTETIYVKTQGEVNTELAEKYKDSLTTEREKGKMFFDAITYREFDHTFEDDNLKISFSGVTQGYLKSVSVPEYTIKPQEIEVPVKRFGVGLNVGYGISQDLTLKPYVGIGLSYSIWEF